MPAYSDVGKIMKYCWVTILVFVVCFSGCATPKYNYMPQSRSISEPPLDTVTTVQVGEEMARQGSVIEHESIYVATPIKVGALSAYTIMPGYFKMTGEDEKSGYYVPYDGADSGRILKNPFSDPWKSIEFYKEHEKIGIITAFNVHVMVDATGVKKIKKAFAASDSFQQTLIYSGIVDHKVRLGYREFSNDFARPAFNNDVEYDLRESNIIGYKGARIEVVEATNQYIKYRVIKNFKPIE